MSNDPITTTTRTSWFSRLGSAFGGVLTGLALIVGAIILLAWNEARSVQSIRANNEGAGAVTTVTPDTVDPANEGRLVHLTGPLEAEGAREDAALGFSVAGVSLTRTVEYYHWVETRRSETRTRLGGGEETVTTYSYDRQWVSTPQDSSGFHQSEGHGNPAPAVRTETIRAESGRVGGFTVDQAVLRQISPSQAVPLTSAQAEAATRALSSPVTVVDGGFHVGANASTPTVGDMRIRYQVAPQNMVISLVGAQNDGAVRPYATRAGTPILLVRSGAASAAEMFEGARAANQTLSWILRAVGAAALIAAIGMVLAPLAVLADVLPILGSILRVGTGLVAFILGLAISAIVIALAWIAYRPVVAIVLIVAAGAIVAGLFWLRRRNAA